MRLLISVLTLLFFAAGAPVAAAEGLSPVVVSKRDCERIVRHHDTAGAAYQPGVDVRGRPVAPADLGGGSGVRLHETIIIEIGIDLAEKYGLGAAGKYTGEGRVGTVAVSPEGHVSFNGTRIDRGESAALARACRRARGG